MKYILIALGSFKMFAIKTRFHAVLVVLSNGLCETGVVVGFGTNKRRNISRETRFAGRFGRAK